MAGRGITSEIIRTHATRENIPSSPIKSSLPTCLWRRTRLRSTYVFITVTNSRPNTKATSSLHSTVHGTDATLGQLLPVAVLLPTKPAAVPLFFFGQRQTLRRESRTLYGLRLNFFWKLRFAVSVKGSERKGGPQSPTAMVGSPQPQLVGVPPNFYYGRRIIHRARINESCTLYDSRRFVIEYLT